jgi:hypothetical protein
MTLDSCLGEYLFLISAAMDIPQHLYPVFLFSCILILERLALHWDGGGAMVGGKVDKYVILLLIPHHTLPILRAQSGPYKLGKRPPLKVIPPDSP